MIEAEFIALLRPLATHPAARGLVDDAAVLPGFAGGELVLTHDVLVEGVHYLPEDPAEDVAWKLVAVNLSDLAAKGAVPVGVLLGYPLGNDAWDRRFVAGLSDVLRAYDVPLLGGDTVRGPRVLGMTAVGCSAVAPARTGARAGDALWVTGLIGLAGLGLAFLKKREGQPFDKLRDADVAGALSILRMPELVEGLPFSPTRAIRAYRRPTPRLAEGQALAPLVTAMSDVSDGLLIDTARMAAASGLAATIDLDCVPHAGEVMAAVTAGDDYELLFAAAPGFVPPVRATQIGIFATGSGLSLTRGSASCPLPERLGWEHGD